ncbi:hypothetical protein KVV02_007533 [Mortierella alpina]|uniref:Uncharacterized protein n=1 Tax=Mortierella alpina TaxID=64518 RepID=A0A9P8A6Z0_MORAP|nr:hypothetical protein KVV02_007533 [Mortierella alpina]
MMRLVHYAVDAILISAVLAGIKRSTSDERHSDHERATILSIQERRLQLEAFKAERALNKSMRSSVRGSGQALRSSQLLHQSVHGAHPRSCPSVDGMNESDMQERELVSQCSGTQAGRSTRSIIRHYNALSKTMDALRGVRHHGSAARKVEKRSILAVPSTINMMTNSQRHPASTASLQFGLASTRTVSGAASQDEKSALSLLGASVSSTPVSFIGNKSVRQDGHTSTRTGNRQEDIYLSQARLLQWYTMGKKAAEHFANQERSAEAQFEMVGRLILEKQASLLNLKQRFEVEQELVHLETTLEAQRDKLLTIVQGVETFKSSYEEFTSALDQEAKYLHIPAIDDSNLGLWMQQIQHCRKAVECSLEHSQKDRELLRGIAYSMKSLCDIVEQEVQELKCCTGLLNSIRDAESQEHSLLASSLER